MHIAARSRQKVGRFDYGRLARWDVRQLIFSTTILALLAWPLRATSIVAVRTPNSIVVGADSKMVNGDMGQEGSVCKILTSNGVFFSAARIWSSSAGHFSVAAIAADALNSTSDLASGVNEFEEHLIQPLERLLTLLKTVDPARFQREFDGKSAVDVLFVKFEAGYPAVLSRSFIVRDEGSHGPTVQINREECSRDCSQAFAYAAIGQHAAIDKALAENPYLWNEGLAKAVRKLITLEISAKPTLVGPPVSILSIDESGPHWIEQGLCPDIGTH